MNPFEKQIRTLLCFVLLVAFLVSNDACSAQEQSKKLSNSLGEPVAPDFDSEADKLSKLKLDINFQKPLSVEDFVTYLKHETKHGINIVVAKDARNVMVPSIELEQVSILSALDAMQVATQDEAYWDEAGGEFVTIQRDPELAQLTAMESAILVRVFNVSHIVGQNDKAEASMLSAIEIGLEMSSSSPENVNMKFHKETKLLFIRASASDVDTVMQVIDQIGKGLPKSRGGYESIDEYGE